MKGNFLVFDRDRPPWLPTPRRARPRSSLRLCPLLLQLYPHPCNQFLVDLATTTVVQLQGHPGDYLGSSPSHAPGRSQCSSWPPAWPPPQPRPLFPSCLLASFHPFRPPQSVVRSCLWEGCICHHFPASSWTSPPAQAPPPSPPLTTSRPGKRTVSLCLNIMIFIRLLVIIFGLCLQQLWPQPWLRTGGRGGREGDWLGRGVAPSIQRRANGGRLCQYSPRSSSEWSQFSKWMKESSLGQTAKVSVWLVQRAWSLWSLDAGKVSWNIWELTSFLRLNME